MGKFLCFPRQQDLLSENKRGTDGTPVTTNLGLASVEVRRRSWLDHKARGLPCDTIERMHGPRAL